MIKLQLPEKPVELTEEEELKLINEFKANGTAVWRKKYIVDALLEMSNYKCAYSEQALNVESAYMEVEHFKHKDKYKDDVVKWGNLLPACKKCNTTKNKWDVLEYPIVNPLVDVPGESLYVKGFRFYKKNEKGHNTIDAVALSDRDHFVNPRALIGLSLAEKLEAYFERIKEVDTLRRRQNAMNNIKSLLRDCGPQHVYSAVLSTYILYELPTYKELEDYLRGQSLWDEELEEIKTSLLTIALPEHS